MTRVKYKKNKHLRHVEYYDLQNEYDKLYENACKNINFYNLVSLIMDRRNIMLAYRNIKKNKGSKTPGTDKNNILNLAETDVEVFIERMQNKLLNYQPKPVRRKDIPKDNTGKTRPLGIPCIEDRLIQQSILQVLEPICEAKFHKHSYGFRPNRNTHHAIKRLDGLINNSGYHYAVDVDIKGFFDNVDHGKLLKQIWSLGIRDKNLISIISKALKAEIIGEGIPTKGTPQGGILSPLLANIVLNELDWWISDQYETNDTMRSVKTGEPFTTRGGKYAALRNTKLKPMFIVRYADDFKIMCKDYKTAQKAFIATKKWLKERLNLEISPEKSKVTNLRKNYTDFLGFKFKVRKLRNKWQLKSRISNKAMKKIESKIDEGIYYMEKQPNAKGVNVYNSIILGIQNYYSIATMVNIDLQKIAYFKTRKLESRLRKHLSKRGLITGLYKTRYKDYNFKKIFVSRLITYPILGTKFRIPYAFNQDICKYTIKGRKLIHDKLQDTSEWIIRWLLRNPIRGNVELNDNRISVYTSQKGKCKITKKKLEIGFMELHHVIPKSLGGTDKYENLIYIDSRVHKLIHCKYERVARKYIEELSIGEEIINKINQYRKKANQPELQFI